MINHKNIKWLHYQLRYFLCSFFVIYCDYTSAERTSLYSSSIYHVNLEQQYNDQKRSDEIEQRKQNAFINESIFFRCRSDLWKKGDLDPGLQIHPPSKKIWWRRQGYSYERNGHILKFQLLGHGGKSVIISYEFNTLTEVLFYEGNSRVFRHKCSEVDYSAWKYALKSGGFSNED